MPIAQLLTSHLQLTPDSHNSNLHRTRTTETRGLRLAVERLNQPLNGRVHPQRRRDHAAKHVEDIPGVEERLSHEAPPVPPEPAIDVVINTRRGVKSFLPRQHRVFPDPVPEPEQRRQRVSEGQDEQRADKAGDERELRHRGADDEGDDPVHRDHGRPEHLPRRGRQRRRPEDALQELDVEHLHPDVAVQPGRDEPRDEAEDVRGRLPHVGRQALDDGVEAVLALEGVHVDAEHEVDGVDEDLAEEEGLPEVHRVPHLGHEGSEDEATAVGVDRLVQSVERGREAGAARCHAVGRGAGVRVDWPGTEGVAEGGFGRCEVRRGVRYDAHAIVMVSTFEEQCAGV